MVLNGASVLQQMRHAIDGGEPSSELNALDIANQAGEWLYDCYNWRWKLRPGVALATVEGQSYIDLPVDFGEMVGIPRGPATAPYPIRMVPFEQIAQLRGITSPTSTAGFYAALVYVTADQDTQAVSAPRLELWPSPAEDSAEVATLYYSASWVPMSSDNSIAVIPRYCERLYVEIARAFLAGLEDESEGTTDDRLEMIVNGQLFAAARMRDQGEQNEYGQMATGPAGSEVSYGDPSPFSTYQLPTS